MTLSTPFITLLTPAGSRRSLAHLGDYESRGSVFLAHAARVEGAGDCRRFLSDVRAEHPEARHVCYAALYRENGGGNPTSGALEERMSDDGEPSGTAAKPILEAIHFSGVQDCMIAVSRRFGGTLLGAGGLVRAYSSAASQALRAAPKGVLVSRERLEITVSYPRLKTFDHLSRRFGASVEKRVYAQNVTTLLAVDRGKTRALRTALAQAFSGGPKIVDLGSRPTVRPLPRG